jgi:FkbM family methyltransferase
MSLSRISRFVEGFHLGKVIVVSTTTLRFDGDDPALKSHIGKRAGGFIRLTEAGCGLYGPYVDLPAGRCDARILLQGRGKGTVRIDMMSSLGRVELAGRNIDLRDVPENVLSISADLPRPMFGCEVRLHTHGDAVAEIVGVEITFPTPETTPPPASHSWDERALVESRAKIGGTRAEAEQVFNRFTRYRGPGRPGYVTNFLGGVISMEVASGLRELGLDGVVEDLPFDGSFHGGVIEWVGTLRSVLEAGEQFRMLELGAGWGPWCVIAYKAAMQRRIADCHIIGVEGDSGHVRFMEENFSANGLEPRSFSIISAVVGAEDGTARFPQAKDPAGVYGGLASTGDQEHFDSFMKYAMDRVEEVDVPQVSLETLTRDVAIVDLVHCDIQGGELAL